MSGPNEPAILRGLISELLLAANYDPLILRETAASVRAALDDLDTMKEQDAFIEARRKRMRVASVGEAAFWATVADAYPEIGSGDFPFDESAKLHDAMARAIEIWVETNTIASDDDEDGASPRDVRVAELHVGQRFRVDFAVHADVMTDATGQDRPHTVELDPPSLWVVTEIEPASPGTFAGWVVADGVVSDVAGKRSANVCLTNLDAIVTLIP